jgi:hypothetical protein
MQLQMLCYKLLKKIFITGLLIVATVPHDYRKRYNFRMDSQVLEPKKQKLEDFIPGNSDATEVKQALAVK